MPIASPSVQQQYVPPRIRSRIRGRAGASWERAAESGAIVGEDAYLEAVRLRGGRDFVERLKRYGRTPEGKPLILRQWFLEACEAIGDYRIASVVSTGASRIGKTMSNALASVDLQIAGRMPIAFIYADLRSQAANSATEWRPMAETWITSIEKDIGLKLRSTDDITTSATWSLDNISAHFRYAGTQAGSSPDKPAMGNAATGYSAYVLWEDERSQWAPGLSFRSRQNNSRFPAVPLRQIGTPGAGIGIELFANKCDHYFIPHYRCSCGAEKPLDPFGCVFTSKVVEVGGKRLESFLTQSNRPHDWWMTDPDRPIDSAIIACSDCGKEITEEARTIGAWMRCRKTGIDLRDYLDGTDPDDLTQRSIALHFSPLCREGKPNLAQLLVMEGLNEERNAADWVQQDLGIPTSPRGDTLTIATLKPLVGLEGPRSTAVPPRWVVAGVDCGRGEHWLWIEEVFPPKNWQRISAAKIFQKSIRVVRFGGPVKESEIEGLLEKYSVTSALIDNEPSRSGTAILCNRTVLEMADQKGRRSAQFEKKAVKDGGESYDCWFFNADFYKQAVVDSAIGIDDLAAWDGKPSYRFPDEWKRYLHQNSETSPLRHLCAMKFDAIEQKWIRPSNHIDDLFFAAMFAQVALSVAIDQGCGDGDIEW